MYQAYQTCLPADLSGVCQPPSAREPWPVIGSPTHCSVEHTQNIKTVVSAMHKQHCEDVPKRAHQTQLVALRRSHLLYGW